jgi:hypothetical protein
VSVASDESYTFLQTAAISRMYFFRSSRGDLVSGIGVTRSPLSTTV